MMRVLSSLLLLGMFSFCLCQDYSISKAQKIAINALAEESGFSYETLDNYVRTQYGYSVDELSKELAARVIADFQTQGNPEESNAEMQASESNIGLTTRSLTSTKNYFALGAVSGSSLSKAVPFTVGFVGGAGLSVLGWGGAYLYYATVPPKPPFPEVMQMDTPDRMQYQEGYAAEGTKVRKKAAGWGGACGTLFILWLSLSLLSLNP